MHQQHFQKYCTVMYEHMPVIKLRLPYCTCTYNSSYLNYLNIEYRARRVAISEVEFFDVILQNLKSFPQV
jgi:hypothetical protein